MSKIDKKAVFMPIPGFEEYQIDRHGNIRSDQSGKILKHYVGGTGYWMTTFWVNKKSKLVRVHRMLALTYIPNPENKAQVNHIDSNRLNNSLDNLEWVTHDENMAHSPNMGVSYKVKSRPVINLETGIYYDSVLDASIAYGIVKHVLYHCVYKNSTRFPIEFI